MLSELLVYCATVKIKLNDIIFVTPIMGVFNNNMNIEDIIECSFIPLYIVIRTTPKFIDSLDTLVNIFKEEGVINEDIANEALNAFTEITEDEYYKID